MRFKRHRTYSGGDGEFGLDLLEIDEMQVEQRR
jgi:hypothetical protein